MKWLFAIGSLVLIAGVTYYLVFADRTFSSYDGAREGMTIKAAAEQLGVEGWTLLSSSSALQRSDCTGNERYYFVQLRSPGHLLILGADKKCKVTNIARRYRGSDL